MRIETFIKNNNLDRKLIAKELSIIAAEEFIIHMEKELMSLPDDPYLKRSICKDILLIMTLRLLWTLTACESKYKESVKEYIKELDGFFKDED